MENDFLSVIIPIYNCSEFAEPLIDKLIYQRDFFYPETQIIVIDDCSTEDMSWLDKKRVDIHYKCKENGGVSRARNIGLDISPSAYVSFIDADDDIADNYLDTIYKVLRHCHCDYAIFDYTTQGQLVRSSGRIRDLPAYAVWAYAFKRSCIGTERFNENLNVAEDMDWLPRVIKGKKVKRVSVPIYHYKWNNNPDSLSKRFNRGDLPLERN